MAAGEIGKCFWDAIKHARRRMLELRDHRGHLLERAPLREPPGKLHITLLERASEASHAISMLLNIVPLGLVQDMPRVGAGIAEGLAQGNNTLQRVIKANIAFPK